MIGLQASGEISRKECLLLVVATIRKVLQGARWRDAFFQTGTLQRQQCVSKYILARLDYPQPRCTQLAPLPLRAPWAFSRRGEEWTWPTSFCGLCQRPAPKLWGHCQRRPALHQCALPTLRARRESAFGLCLGQCLQEVEPVAAAAVMVPSLQRELRRGS